MEDKTDNKRNSNSPYKTSSAQRTHLLRWLEWPVRMPWWALISCVILIVSAVVGGKNLYFRGDYNIFFDNNNPQLLAFEEIQARFAKTDSLAIVIGPNDGDIFTESTLKLIQELTDSAWQTPYSSRVDSLSNYQHTEAFEDDLLVQDLIPEDFDFTVEQIEKVKQIALNEPVTKRSMISRKGDVSVINITVQLPEIDKTAEVVEVYDFVSNIIDVQQAKHPDIAFYKTGIVAMNYAFMSSAEKDIVTLVPIMLLVVLVFLSLMLRSMTSVLATLVIVIVSVVSTLGISGWLGMQLNIATVNIPTLILTLAVADCVHIVATMKYHMQKSIAKTEAILLSIKANAMPVIITSVTTAVGFFMMNMSDSPVLRDFGSLAALGVMLACSLSLILLPALLALLPIKIKASENNTSSNLMDHLADFVVLNKIKLLVFSTIVIIAAVALIPLNTVSDDSVKYFDQESEFRTAVDFMQDNISGMGSISIAIDSNVSQGIVANEFLQTVDDFTNWLRAQPEVNHVSSMTDIFKRLNKNMYADDVAYYQLPESRELAAQYLLMYEMSLPYGLDLNNQISLDKSSLKLQVTTDNLGSIEMISLENRIYDWFDNTDYTIKASSPSLMFAHIGETNMRSMLISLPVSLLFISCLLIFALRSFKLGILSIIPNMIPAVIGFAIWALISGEVNLGLSVVASLTLGIVVDDGVHFLTKYQLARKEGKSPENAVRYAFHTVGRALWITTVVLIAGFLVLANSTFRLNSDMGQLSSIVILLALIVDFLLLPCLLMQFDRVSNKRR
ncbi:efflux RND transporter permease subunit [Vibrio sp. TH_r3]|uniref:efflux RND transporter permease subunit n=1 Tax=Vibrio sp. TH_r3 TaxID=3082084 RepID=UPI003988999D